jgi:DNA-binding XRE family transcriptional regulator
MPQATLARTLGISPANLFEILKGNHSPNAEVALHIEELLRNTMTIDEPKTLSSAKDRIAELTAELKAAKATTLPPVAVQKPPAVTVTPAIAPATSQAAGQPPVERPLSQLSKKEIADRMDDANARGDQAETNKLWREYSARE